MTETKREFWIIRSFRPHALEVREIKPPWGELKLGDERIHVIEYSAFSSLETKLSEYEGAHSCSVKCERPLCVANRKLQKAVEALKGELMMLQNVNMESGVCCCGDEIAKHAINMGLIPGRGLSSGLVSKKPSGAGA